MSHGAHEGSDDRPHFAFVSNRHAIRSLRIVPSATHTESLQSSWNPGVGTVVALQPALHTVACGERGRQQLEIMEVCLVN